jgi:hypothetical protein
MFVANNGLEGTVVYVYLLLYGGGVWQARVNVKPGEMLRHQNSFLFHPELLSFFQHDVFAWCGLHIHVKRTDGIDNISSNIPPFSFIPIDNRICHVCTECVRVELELLPFLGLTWSSNCHIPVQASDDLATTLLINGRWGSRNDKTGMLPALVLLLSTAIAVSSSLTFNICVCVLCGKLPPRGQISLIECTIGTYPIL